MYQLPQQVYFPMCKLGPNIPPELSPSSRPSIPPPLVPDLATKAKFSKKNFKIFTEISPKKPNLVRIDALDEGEGGVGADCISDARSYRHFLRLRLVMDDSLVEQFTADLQIADDQIRESYQHGGLWGGAEDSLRVLLRAKAHDDSKRGGI